MAQVVHHLPERPRTLRGSIEEVSGVQTARGYEIAGPILKYVQGGVRVLGLNEGDRLGRYELDQLHVTYQMLESLKTTLKLHTVSDKIARISERTSGQTTQTPLSTKFGF